MHTFRTFLTLNAKRIWKGRHYHQQYNKMVRFCDFQGTGEKPMDGFTSDDIYAYMDYLSGTKGLTDNTVNHYIVAITALFKFAVEKKDILYGPMVRTHTIESERPRYFSDSEILSLETFLKDSRYPTLWDFVCLSLNTGMRLGEIRGITPEMISKDYNWIHLPNWLVKNSKGRDIALSDKTRACLKRMDYQPSKHYKHRAFYQVWLDARKFIAPNDKHFVFHVCRHTAATRMANDLSVSTAIIGKILGHRSANTTLKYVHEKPETLLAIATQLSA